MLVNAEAETNINLAVIVSNNFWSEMLWPFLA